MKTLELVKNYGLGALEELSIRINRHETDGRVILNYSQIESPKENEIVRECRALTISEDGELIARSFERFFNWGEALEITKNFEWDHPFKAWDKEDGSLIVFFYYKGEWRVQTRNSFAEALIEKCPYTWRQVFYQALDKTSFMRHERSFRNLTFVMELCSPYNRVVREYNESTLFLLAIFHGYVELSDQHVDQTALVTNIIRPKEHVFKHYEDAASYISEVAENDVTFEGVVLKDSRGLRLKIKNPEHVRLARIFDNGNIFLPKYLVPIMLAGELDEFAVYFPEIYKTAQEYQQKIDRALEEVNELWTKHKDKPSDKYFALGVKNSKYSSILFNARNKGGEPKDYFTSDFIVKKVL